MKKFFFNIYILSIIFISQNSFSQVVPKEVFEIKHPEFPNTEKTNNSFLQKESFILNTLNFINNNINSSIINELKLSNEDIIAIEINFQININGKLILDSLSVNVGGIKAMENNVYNSLTNFPKLTPAKDLKNNPINYNFLINIEFIVMNNKLFIYRFLDKSYNENYVNYNNLIFPINKLDCKNYKLTNGQSPTEEVCHSIKIRDLLIKNTYYSRELENSCSNCRVNVQFSLKKNGKIEDIKIVFDRSKGSQKYAKSFEDEILKAIVKLPILEPVKKYELPIDYKIFFTISINQ